MLESIFHESRQTPKVGYRSTGAGVPSEKWQPTRAIDGPNIYMSINVITADPSTGQVSARLLAEQIPGGGLVETEHHEILWRSFEDRGRLAARLTVA